MRNGAIKSFSAAIALLLSSGAAWAEDAKDCAKIGDDAKRLICYDLIFKLQQTATTVSKWDVTEETSKINDRKNVILAVLSTERVSGRYGLKDRAQLTLTCREGKSSFYISFGGHFMSSLSGMVTYRVDKRPATKRSMVETTDHQALGLWTSGEASSFAKELYGANSLYIQATPHSESPVSAEFPIAGLEQAIKPLQAACKWPTSNPKPASPGATQPR